MLISRQGDDVSCLHSTTQSLTNRILEEAFPTLLSFYSEEEGGSRYLRIVGIITDIVSKSLLKA
jgi:hypothetical protein